MADEIQLVGTAPVDATPETRPDLFGTRGQLRPDGDGGIASYMLADRPEYATPGDSGVESGFYVGNRGLPWHVTLARSLGEKELMTDAGHLLTKEEALAAIGGNFTVLREEIRTESGIVIPNKVATVRSDTKQPLGVVGTGYKLHQPIELASFTDLVVGTGQAKYETGGLMLGGTWLFLSMELDHLDITVPGDPSPLKTFLVVRTSFDGSSPTTGDITRVRTVCQNTYKLARKGAITSFRIAHRGTLEGKLEQVQRALQITVKSTATTQQLVDKLALTKVVDAQVREILEQAVWPVKAEDGDAEAERQSRHAERAFENYMSSETLGDTRGTAWGVLNAVTEYVDHGVSYHGRSRTDEDARYLSLMFGAGAEAEQRTTSALLKLAK